MISLNNKYIKPVLVEQYDYKNATITVNYLPWVSRVALLCNIKSDNKDIIKEIIEEFKKKYKDICPLENGISGIYNGETYNYICTIYSLKNKECYKNNLCDFQVTFCYDN